jgi:hypothetical protein
MLRLVSFAYLEKTSATTASSKTRFIRLTLLSDAEGDAIGC